MNTLKSDQGVSKSKTPLGSLKSKAVNIPTNIVTPFLIIATVTVIYLSSVGADVLVLWVIRLLFGDAVSRNDLAEKILKLIQIFSTLGTLATYVMTVAVLLYLYKRDFLKISWGTNEKDGFKHKAMKWLEDTGTLLLDVVGVTFIFIVLIGAIALALSITNLVLSPILVNPAKIFTSFAIAVAYVLTLMSSLFKDGKDLLKISRDSYEKGEEIS